MYENGRMEPVERIQEGGKRDEGEWYRGWI
jgi:hypothetical protein